MNQNILWSNSCLICLQFHHQEEEGEGTEEEDSEEEVVEEAPIVEGEDLIPDLGVDPDLHEKGIGTILLPEVGAEVEATHDQKVLQPRKGKPVDQDLVHVLPLEADLDLLQDQAKLNN